MNSYKKTFLVLSFAFISCFSFGIGSNSATIVFHIDELTSDESAKILETLSQESNINLEYRCETSGVFVFKIKQSHLSDVADVKVYFYGKIKSIVEKSRIDILHTELQINEDSSKC